MSEQPSQHTIEMAFGWWENVNPLRVLDIPSLTQLQKVVKVGRTSLKILSGSAHAPGYKPIASKLMLDGA